MTDPARCSLVSGFGSSSRARSNLYSSALPFLSSLWGWGDRVDGWSGGGGGAGPAWRGGQFTGYLLTQHAIDPQLFKQCTLWRQTGAPSPFPPTPHSKCHRCHGNCHWRVCMGWVRILQWHGPLGCKWKTGLVCEWRACVCAYWGGGGCSITHGVYTLWRATASSATEWFQRLHSPHRFSLSRRLLDWLGQYAHKSSVYYEPIRRLGLWLLTCISDYPAYSYQPVRPREQRPLSITSKMYPWWRGVLSRSPSPCVDTAVHHPRRVRHTSRLPTYICMKPSCCERTHALYPQTWSPSVTGCNAHISLPTRANENGQSVSVNEQFGY